VTVVATGLGKPVHARLRSPCRPRCRRGGSSTHHASCATQVTDGPTDYAMLDKPTVQRQRAVGDGLRAESESEDLLDIPAFLRRQAD